MVRSSERQNVDTASLSSDESDMLILMKFERVELSLRESRRQLLKSPGDVRLCHNDALYGNIMRHVKTGSIQLIDFEYGDMNWRFDIANHFNEFAGGTGTEKTGPGYAGVPDYTRLPSSKQKRCLQGISR